MKEIRFPRRFARVARRFLSALIVIGSVVLAASEVRAEHALDVDGARALFAEGVERVDRGEFAEALEIFRRIQRSRPHPIILYNMAWCLARLDRHREAIAAFDSYLEQADEESPQRVSEARIELARLQELMEEREPDEHPPPPEPPEAPDEPEPTRGRRHLSPGWFWSALGLTAATAIAMAVTGGLTLQRNDR
jgi:tetratricopeptide (TPR) repeat protein